MSTNAAAGPSATKEVQFEKVLWRKQPFADNFVPATFLCDLRTNSQVVLPSLTQLTRVSLRISTRFLGVVLLALWFVHLHLGTVDAELVLLVGGGGAALYALVSSALVIEPSLSTRHQDGGRRREKGKKLVSKIILAVVLLAVSPVLRTLTESTTSDSIWALSVMLFGVHLTLADYTSPATRWKQRANGLSDTLSFNAAMSASVVLASRLHTDSETFTLLALATWLFAPPSHASGAPSQGGGEWKPFLTHYVATMATTTLFWAVQTERAAAANDGWIWMVAVWIHLAVAFVSGVCPWWIVRAQRWKMELKGPWDPAEPVLSTRQASRARR